MLLIMGIASAAATALAVWRRLRNVGGEGSAIAAVSEARRTASIVNAVAYAFAVIFDAMAARRTASLAIAGSAPSARPLPARIGTRAGDSSDDD